ncbi:MAG TPA: hypothetical protein VFI25_09505 [Planctomycetota bacterium]|nr:hypothetical protein [Planctomycetota bacterium]
MRDGAGEPVVGATVVLVPADQIDTTPITGASVQSGAAAAHDEPLEDLLASAPSSSFPQAVTGSTGRYKISGVPEGDYYFFVQPSASDAEHVPGGSRSRRATPSDSLLGTSVDLEVSSSPPASATYVGSTTCLACHRERLGAIETAHFFPLRVPGAVSDLQDTSRYPNIDASLANFPSVAAFTSGTVLWYSNFNPSISGPDKFTVGLSDPTPSGATLYLKAYLWRDAAGGQYKVTIQNVINPADPLSPATFVVRLVQGGAIFKQRYLLEVPGLLGLYPFAQFNFEGNEASYDRSRKVYVDYRMDSFWNAASNTLQTPPGSRAWQGNCASCHFTGFSTTFNAPTSEWLADAVDDPGGAFDIDGDGSTDEVGVGCESCHGPGSAHVAAAAPRFIVNPANLSPERANLVCGRCHDRPKGAGTVQDEEPLNAANEFARPGVGRAEWLANFTSVNGPAAGDLWVDSLHSKKHHQQYADLLKSKHYRNGTILVTCADCHTSHGESTQRWGLRGDPEDPESALCQSCHLVEPLPHMLAETGSYHAGLQTTCVACHMPETGKTGSGHYGYLLGQPTGSPATDPSLVYWVNDISSHAFDVPSKFSPGVAGVLPGNAMPVPYTNSCGTCHDPSSLPWTPPSTDR